MPRSPGPGETVRPNDHQPSTIYLAVRSKGVAPKSRLLSESRGLSMGPSLRMGPSGRLLSRPRTPISAVCPSATRAQFLPSSLVPINPGSCSILLVLRPAGEASSSPFLAGRSGSSSSLGRTLTTSKRLGKAKVSHASPVPRLPLGMVCTHRPNFCFPYTTRNGRAPSTPSGTAGTNRAHRDFTHAGALWCTGSVLARCVHPMPRGRWR